MLTVLVTGATGFVGQRFMERSNGRYKLVPVSLRNARPKDIDLTGIDTIVHLAGKAHDMQLKDEKVYFDINYELTKELGIHAWQSGVKHFIYVSSVKVYGEGSDTVLDENSDCHPEDPYGKSKLKGEKAAQGLPITVSIVRPPVVYGPGVKGNIIRLLQAVDKGRPLPLGKTGNHRSMVFLDNLIELIQRVIDTGTPGIFVPTDEQPISTDVLIKLMSQKLGKKITLISIPGFMRKIMKAVKPGLYKRLFGSFVIDNWRTNRKLNFKPPYSTEYGVEQMVNWYKEQKK
jgi:UDP-glucose 4-epimerase